MSNPSRSTTARCFVWAFVGSTCGLILGVFVTLNQHKGETLPASKLEFDNNGDGKVDLTFFYENNVVVRSEHDRNFDGNTDYFEWYDNGLVVRSESDDNFDSKIDGWQSFQLGNLWLSKHDTDKNGIPDVFQHFEFGVLRWVVWRPNESSKVSRIELFNSSGKVKEFRDANEDGLLDLVRDFDVFENLTTEKVLNPPLEAKDVISGASKQTKAVRGLLP